MVEIDGKVLIDEGTKPDTVLDTPMNNYAILVSAGGTPEPTDGSLYYNTPRELGIVEQVV